MKTQENYQAAYISEVACQLAEMARTDGFDLLAHLLDMASLEAKHLEELANDGCRDARRS